MFFTYEFKAGMAELTSDFEVKNMALLRMCEDTAGFHSDTLHDGLSDVMRTGKAWVIVAWYMHVARRPKYGETIRVTTWAREINKVNCIREFELSGKDGLYAKVSSKWVTIHMAERRIEWITPERIAAYEPEERTLFDTPVKFRSVLRREYDIVSEYTVLKKDTDIVGHMHNLHYLDYAMMSLPENRQREYDNVMIIYKNEMSAGERFRCGYFVRDGKNTVILSQNEKVNATVQLW